MDEMPPDLTLVADRSRVDADKQRAIDGLEYSLREMSANLLRVMRGAGRPYALFQEIINVSEEILELSKIALPIEFVPQLEAALQEGVPTSEDLDDFDEFLTTVVRGSLQMAASRIRGQLTHERKGQGEIIDGVRIHEAYVERIRQKRLAEAKATPPRGPRKTSRNREPVTKRASPAPARSTTSESLEPRKLPGESTADFMIRCKKLMEASEQNSRPRAKRPSPLNLLKS